MFSEDNALMISVCSWFSASPSAAKTIVCAPRVNSWGLIADIKADVFFCTPSMVTLIDGEPNRVVVP